MNTPNTMLPVPKALAQLFEKVSKIEATHDAAILKADTKSAHDLCLTAPTFAAAFDKYATDLGLVSAAGNVKMAPTYDVIARQLPEVTKNLSLTAVKRVLYVGRFVVAGQEQAMFDRFVNATWTQPDEAVAPDAEPQTFRNYVGIDKLATWCNVQQVTGKRNNANVIVDDVLMTVNEHATRTAPYVEPTPEPDAADTSSEEDAAADAEEPTAMGDSPSGDDITNVINVGALSAVFAKCDNDTVSEAIGEYDWSEYNTDELTAVVLSALATLTIYARVGEVLDATA